MPGPNLEYRGPSIESLQRYCVHCKGWHEQSGAWTGVVLFGYSAIWLSCVQVRALRQVSAGQGLMLESSSRRLMQPGMPHHNCPDKASPLLKVL